MHQPASILVLAAMLCSCASPKIEPVKFVPEAKLPPQEIKIYTSPAGGIVDWNGNVLGAAPLTIEVEPQRIFNRPVWPANGAMRQRIRARWPDGSFATETFATTETLPHNIGIVSPNYRINPVIEYWNKKYQTLTQRTGP